VQLRYQTGLTSDEYVNRQAWRDATLSRCPRHPQGGCGFRRHGSYRRQHPAGTRIARWYCRQAAQTFSLLPDCLAARYSGTLAEIEAVVRVVEQARSLESAADRLRPQIELPGAVRWARRRVRAVQGTLTTLRGLLPELLAQCPATLSAFGERLGTEAVLPTLRTLAADFLDQLPPPLGLRPPLTRGGESASRRQHDRGPDPPSGFR
jgi:hypothetical protein